MATKYILKLEEVSEDQVPIEQTPIDEEEKPKRKAKKVPPPEILEPKEITDPTGLYCHSCKTKTSDVDLKEASCKGRTPDSAERRTLSATCKICNKKKHSFAKKI